MQLTQYSINLPALKNFSSATYYSVFRHGNEIVKNVNTFGSFNTRHGQLGFRDQLQFGSTHRYGVEWLRNLASPDSYIRIGLDRVRAVQGSAAIAPTASVRLPFPGGQRIQLTYTGDRNSHLFQIELSGPVMRSLHIERDDTGGLALAIWRPEHMSFKSTAPRFPMGMLPNLSR